MIVPHDLLTTTRRLTLTGEQRAAVDLMQGGANVFLSGMAGTGKSMALLEFISQSFRSVDVCATTGIAALNLQDQFRQRAGISLPAHTIYRWAGIMTGPAPGQKVEDFYEFLTRNQKVAFRRVKECETLVIDEISMLPGAVLDYLDYHCQKLRRDQRPFGGIQVIAVGDFLQLPPVAKNGKYDWAFRAQSWAAARFKPICLKVIHRQDEPEFVAALNAFREGKIDSRTATVLARRVQLFVDRKVIRLMTHNTQVDRWNAYQIGELEGNEVTYAAQFSGPEHECEFLRKSSITPVVLTIKRGARVMVTRNILLPEQYLVNGQCGTVLETRPCSVLVAMDNGEEVDVPTQSRSYDPQRNDSATMTQIPLRPAYAMTIHKSQGLTLDKAHIDIRAAREPGQAYVALSRLRSLQGLHLKEWIKGVHVSDAAINFYRSFKS